VSESSGVATQERKDGPVEHEPSAADLGERATPGEKLTPAERRARLFGKVGLFVAPVGIAVLAVAIYFYRESLDLANAPRQQQSALDWSGKLQPQIVEHLQISFFATALVILVAVPLGIALTRPRLRRVSPFVVTIANIGQALPGYGLLVLFLLFLGQGQRTAILALALYALLPVLRNTMVGLNAVDRNVLEAGRGMGMTKLRVLTRLELPLAVPVIMAGVRTATILCIGMATLAFIIGGGGLGITINSGLKLRQDSVLIIGALLVAVIALTFDWLGALAERYLKPRGT
jgi:osmoprotectant transport system permease protein